MQWHGRAMGISCGGSWGSSPDDSPMLVTPRTTLFHWHVGWMQELLEPPKDISWRKEGRRSHYWVFGLSLILNLAEYCPINSSPEPAGEDDKF